MATRWIATNNGGFWEEYDPVTGAIGKSTASSPAVTTSASQIATAPATSPWASPASLSQSFNQNEQRKAREAAIRGEIYIPATERNYTTDGRYDNITAIQEAAYNTNLPWENVNAAMAAGDIKTPEDVYIAASFLQPSRGGINPDVRRELEARSSQTGLPLYQIMQEAAKTDPVIAAELAKVSPAWIDRYGSSYITAPNQNPYDADQDSWLKQNSGIVSGIIAAATGVGAPLLGAAAGFGTSAAIGGLPLATQNIPWALGGAYGSDALAKAGMFGGEAQGFANTRVTPWNYNNVGSQSATSRSTGINAQTGQTPWQSNLSSPSAGISDSLYNPSMSNAYNTTAQNGLSLSNGQIDQSLVDRINNLGSTGVVNPAETADIIKKFASSTNNQSAMDLIKAGQWSAAIKSIASTPAGTAVIGSLIGKVLGGNESAPEQAAIDTGGLNITQEYINRLAPEYYAMSQAEKDRIYNNAMEKISANLAERGVTRGAVAVEATKDLLAEIELADMQQQRQYAAIAFNSFVDYLNGQESRAFQNYVNATNMFNQDRANFNNTIANLIESTLAKPSGSGYTTQMVQNKDGSWTSYVRQV